MELTTIKAYIGSNNHTKEVEIDKIIAVASKYHTEFTLQRNVIGYWKGQPEHTVILLISDDYQKIMYTLGELKEVLQQEAIGYQIDSALHLI